MPIHFTHDPEPMQEPVHCFVIITIIFTAPPFLRYSDCPITLFYGRRISRMMPASGKELDSHIMKLVKHLSEPEVYPRKHAAWTLARMARKGHAAAIVSCGAVPALAKCLGDGEAIVRGRALWALSVLVKHGERDAVLRAGITKSLEEMTSDNTEIDITRSGSSEIMRATISELASELRNTLR